MHFWIELQYFLQILMALLLGGLIGWEREHHGSQAGIRTYATISLGSCIFGLISIHGVGIGDTSRISAQVVSGIGFLGAGIIFRQGTTVGGLTTAATLWASAAVGLAIAYGMYAIAVLSAFCLFIILLLPTLRWWYRFSGKERTGILKDE